MSVRLLQKAILYIKEVQDIGLFALMSDARIFMFFTGTPLYYVMLPFIGLLLTGSAIINGYYLAKSGNKNLDQWFGFIVSVICAVLASISLYGAALATAYGFTFVAGPWLFFSSVAFAAAHQIVMLGINAYRAYESITGSAQRMHYIQAALNNLFLLGLLTAIIGAVVFVMLFPIAPAVGSAFALSAVAFTSLNILWRFIPHNWKVFIKGLVFLEKPDLTAQVELTESQSIELIKTAEISLNDDARYHRLFTRCDFSAQIKVMDLSVAEAYLKNIIVNKIAALQDRSLPATDKNNQKAALLFEVLRALTQHMPISKKHALQMYPLAFQSFWAEKGEVEQLVDAAQVFHEKYKQHYQADAESALDSDDSEHSDFAPA